ncbi:MAG: class I SAM-dependent methyltransferase [Patescibacteria group bacterium]|nr:class I SAM-dependent methyltransferase [Patescibacteria group bacterium]
MSEKMENSNGYLDFEMQEHIFVKNEIEKAKLFVEKDKTREGQERMWDQLYKYAKIIKKIETDSIPDEKSKKEPKEVIIKERTIPLTSRTEEEIARCYNLKVEELEKLLMNKKVLDFGCGKSQLSKELKNKKINTDIISFDIKKEALIESESEKSIQGSGENLPFSAEKFDVILATYSLPYWASSVDMIEKNFKELLRVLRKDGMLYINPITDIPNRISIKDDFNPRDIFSIKECHSEVNEILNKIQIKFINLLGELKIDDKYEIILGKNYFQEMKCQTVDEIDRREPTIIRIKKIR